MAAKRLFAEDGFQHVTMRRIAGAVGVSATALYVYFADKDAILQAIAKEHFAALLIELEHTVQPDRPASQNLRAGLHAYVSFALNHPDEYRLTFMRTGRRDEWDPCKSIPEADFSFEILLQGVQTLIDEGFFVPRPATLLAEALWVCAHGVASLLLTKPEECASDPDTLIGQVIDMAVAGLCLPQNLPLLT